MRANGGTCQSSTNGGGGKAAGAWVVFFTKPHSLVMTSKSISGGVTSIPVMASPAHKGVFSPQMSRQAAKEDFFISSFFPAVSLPHCFALLQKTLYSPWLKGL
jgi:hypothetical protein